jgi:hypothetical protein
LLLLGACPVVVARFTVYPLKFPCVSRKTVSDILLGRCTLNRSRTLVTTDVLARL